MTLSSLCVCLLLARMFSLALSRLSNHKQKVEQIDGHVNCGRSSLVAESGTLIGPVCWHKLTNLYSCCKMEGRVLVQEKRTSATCRATLSACHGSCDATCCALHSNSCAR